MLLEPTTTQIDPVFSMVNGSLRARANHDHMIGILQEPIANGRIGQVQIEGVTPASFIFSESNSGGVNSVAAECAVLADNKDMLAVSQFGPIRVLQRNLGNTSGNTGAGKYWLVEIGQPATLGSAVISYTTAWTATANESRTWVSPAWGDFMHLGVHGDSELGTLLPDFGQLYISRTGRYEVTVEWNFAPSSPPSWSVGDRVEWAVNWSDGTEYGGFAVDQWEDLALACGGSEVSTTRCRG